MKSRMSSPGQRLLWLAAMVLFLSTPAIAGRNAGGALIVHTNDAVSYSPGGDYCGTLFDNPGSCENAITRTDKDENTPAVIWVLAAFPTGSSPAVTAVQFGLDDNIPEGNWEAWGKCAFLEIPDEGWPETGKGNAIAFASAVTDSLFPIYWFAVDGFAGPPAAYLGTTNYPHGTNLAQFADNSEPPVTDDITHFGTVRWYAAGSTDCPSTTDEGENDSEQSGQDSGPGALPITRSWHDTLFNRDWSFTPSSDELLIAYDSGITDSMRSSLSADESLTPSQPYDAQSHIAAYRIPTGAAIDSLLLRLKQYQCVRSTAPALVDHDGSVKYYVPDRVIVQFRKDLSDLTCNQLVANSGSTTILGPTPGSSNYYKLQIQAGTDPFAAIRDWYQNSNVIFADLVYMLYGEALHSPNDPLFEDQWALENTAQHSGWIAGADTKATAAWDITKGNPNVIISVIDTGMDLGHEDLASNLLPRGDEHWDFTQVPPAGPPNDNCDSIFGSHGTACCGIAVAPQDQLAPTGISGMAPDSRVMPLKISLWEGEHDSRTRAIRYAASRRSDFIGLVLSCSWRIDSDFTDIHSAIQEALLADCVICAAAGNASTNDPNTQIWLPARYPGVIAVGASSPCDERKRRNPPSCEGDNSWESCYGPELSIVAPGTEITTTDCTVNGYDPTSYFSHFRGTSAATPLAAGVCALIYSANVLYHPSSPLSNAAVKEILTASADDLVGPSSEDTKGHDNYMGFGRVNAARAVQLTRDRWLEVPDPAVQIPATGAAWGCWNLDPSPDVLLSQNFSGTAGGAALLQNKGDHGFSTTTSEAQTVAGTRPFWADMYNDYWVDPDLYVADNVLGANDELLQSNYGDLHHVNVTHLLAPSTATLPFDYDCDGDLDVIKCKSDGTLQLLRNDTGSGWVDATQTILNACPAHALAIADYNRDHYPDLLIHTSQCDHDRLLKNVAGTFAYGNTSDILEGVGIWGDYDNDGLPDIYLLREGGNHLYHNLANGHFADVTLPPIDDARPHVADASWGDFDNDGWLDLYVAHSHNEGNRLFRNLGNGTFAVSDSSPLTCDDGNGDSYSVSTCDYDRDGDLDVLVTQLNQSTTRLFRNFADVSGNNWLEVSLYGVVSNSAGIGSRVEIWSGGVDHYRYATVVSMRSQSDDWECLHFGLGPGTIDSVVVTWPSGVRQRVDGVQARTTISVTELRESAAPLDAAPLPEASIVSRNPIAVGDPLTLRLSRPVSSDVVVYSILGRKVRTLLHGSLPAGQYILRWDGMDDAGRGVGAGMYVLRYGAMRRKLAFVK